MIADRGRARLAWQLVILLQLSPALAQQPEGPRIDDSSPPPPASSETEGLPRITDAAQAWKQFLASADPNVVAAKLAIADAVFTEDGDVIVEKCRDAQARLGEMLEAAPISLTAWHSVQQCADALGDEEQSEEAVAAISALSKHALLSNPALGSGSPPIRILGEADAYLLVDALGYEPLYFDYILGESRRHLLLEVAVWDEERSRELILRFDAVDTWIRLYDNLQSDTAPIARAIFVRQSMDQLANGMPEWPGVVAREREKTLTGQSQIKMYEAAVRLAQTGDIGAARLLAAICLFDKDILCGEFAVEAILPFAERRLAMPTIWMAIAYARGRGLQTDGRAANRLLDLADRRLGQHRATLAAGMLLLSQWGAEPLPADIRKRLKRLSREGVKQAAHLLLLDEALGSKSARPRDRERLAIAADTAWFPLQVIAAEAHRESDPERAIDWLRRAAEHGDPVHQVVLAQMLEERTQDAEALHEARRLRVQAGHGGDIASMLVVARDLQRAGNGKQAQAWFLSAAGLGDQEGVYQSATLFVEGSGGAMQSAASALRLLRGAPGTDTHLPSRRLMAQLLLSGVDGIDPDPEAAATLLRRNSHAGDARSTVMLANALMRGIVQSMGGEDGETMLRAAAEQGNGDAKIELAMAIHAGFAREGMADHALRLLQEASDAGSTRALNNLAWLRCTAVDESYFDPQQGRVHMEALMRQDDLPISFRDTIAACQAAAGDFDAAVRMQRQIIGELGAQGKNEDDTAHFRKVLALYEKQTPYREDLRRAAAVESVPEP